MFKTKVLKTKVKTLNVMHFTTLICTMALLEDGKLDSFPVRRNKCTGFLVFFNWAKKNIVFGKMEEIKLTLTCVQCP